MKQSIALLRTEPRARWFFAALAQSSLGTAAAYVALLVIAYERFHSPWAISLVLLAEFLPAMFLAPLLGAAADRWPRKRCAVAADVVRALAFVGIAWVDSFGATVVFALLAGAGTALFRPAVLAALPGLVSSGRSAAATSLYGAITDFGYTAGPALAAAILLAVGAEGLLVLNAATFAVSAAVLMRLSFGEGGAEVDGADPEPRASLLRESREGLRTTAALAGIRVIAATVGVAMFFGGVYNVIELPFATNDLATNASGYSILIALYGLGFIVGSLRGSEGGRSSSLKRRYLQGLALTGAGGLLAGLSPTLVPALAGFVIGGFGNGLFVVHQRLLIQAEVPSRLQGRVFAVTDGLMSWGFAVAVLVAGALTALAGARPLMLATGVGEVALAAGAFFLLRRHWVEGAPAAPRAHGRFVRGNATQPRGEELEHSPAELASRR